MKTARFSHATGSPSAQNCLVSHPFTVIESVVEESLAYNPLAEVEQEVNGRVLADYLQNYEVIWGKVKMALYSNAGTLFKSTRFPVTMEYTWNTILHTA